MKSRSSSATGAQSDGLEVVPWSGGAKIPDIAFWRVLGLLQIRCKSLWKTPETATICLWLPESDGRREQTYDGRLPTVYSLPCLWGCTAWVAWSGALFHETVADDPTVHGVGYQMGIWLPCGQHLLLRVFWCVETRGFGKAWDCNGKSRICNQHGCSANGHNWSFVAGSHRFWPVFGVGIKQRIQVICNGLGMDPNPANYSIVFHILWSLFFRWDWLFIYSIWIWMVNMNHYEDIPVPIGILFWDSKQRSQNNLK